MRLTRRKFIFKMTQLVLSLLVIGRKAHGSNESGRRGYLLVTGSSNINSSRDLRSGLRIGGGPLAIEFMKNKYHIQGIKYLTLPLSELYLAFQHGVIQGYVLVTDGSYSPNEFIERFRLHHLNIRPVPLD